MTGEQVPCITSCYEQVAEESVSFQTDDMSRSQTDDMFTSHSDDMINTDDMFNTDDMITHLSDSDTEDCYALAQSPKRYLYTICENESDPELDILSDKLETGPPEKPAKPGYRLARSREWGNLAECGTDGEDYYLENQSNQLLPSCDATSPDLLPNEFIMFPDNRNVTDDQKKGAMFHRLSSYAETCETATQTTSSGECGRCKLLEQQIQELAEQLELADNEVHFLADECRILHEITDVQNQETLRICPPSQVRKKYRVIKPDEQSQSYFYWFIGCILGFPRYLFKYWVCP